MARSTSIILQSVSGHIGRQLVIKQYGDKTIISKFPEFRKKRKFTSKQKNAQEMMANANDYAKYVLQNETQRKSAQVRLNVTSNKLYTSLVQEYFNNTKKGLKLGKDDEWS